MIISGLNTAVIRRHSYRHVLSFVCFDVCIEMDQFYCRGCYSIYDSSDSFNLGSVGVWHVCIEIGSAFVIIFFAL
jgi:hypothetical protein